MAPICKRLQTLSKTIIDVQNEYPHNETEHKGEYEMNASRKRLGIGLTLDKSFPNPFSTLGMATTFALNPIHGFTMQIMKNHEDP